jgi:hypothetical protein
MHQTEARTYMVSEVCALTGLSRSVITRLFEREPGVLMLPGKVRRTIRIPRRVYERVIRRYTVGWIDAFHSHSVSPIYSPATPE